MNSDGTSQTPMATDHNMDLYASWSPGGTKISYEYGSNYNAPLSLALMNPDGSGKTTIASAPNTYGDFQAWSPDSSKIAFALSSDPAQLFGSRGVYVIKADGSGLTKIANGDIAEQTQSWQSEVWSPDGSKIVYFSKDSGNIDIWRMNPDGSGKEQLTTSSGDDVNPYFSPDGKRVIFESNRNGNFDIYAIELQQQGNGLVAEYHFDGDAKDSSGNGNDGTIYGNATFVQGVSGQALRFDGVDDYVKKISANGVPQGRNPITISFWTKPPNQDTDGYFVLIGQIWDSNGMNDGQYAVYQYHSSPRLGFVVGITQLLTPFPVLTANEWNYISATYDGTYRRLYLNGEEIAMDIPIIPNIRVSNLYVGNADSSLQNNKFKGVIDEVRIYNSALSADEVKAEYEKYGPSTITSITVSPSSATVVAGKTQTFTATDQNGNPVSVIWSVSDESVGTTDAGGVFKALKAGTTTVKAASGGVVGSASVTVEPIPLEATASANPTEGNVPLEVFFTGSASSGVSPYSFSWNFGDGEASTLQNPTHKYKSTGVYDATLTVTDSQGNSVSASPLQIKAFTQWAVVIGINEYTDDEGDKNSGTHWNNLDFQIDNAKRIYSTLTKYYGFPKENVHLLKDEVKNSKDNIEPEDILKEMQWLADNAKENDVVTFYFGGHGSGPVNGEPEYLRAHSNRLYENEFSAVLNQIKSKKLVVILDASWSGGFIVDNGQYSDLASKDSNGNYPAGRIVTTGCTENTGITDEDCAEWGLLKFYTTEDGLSNVFTGTGGVFTGLFDLGLRGGISKKFGNPDLDNNGRISVEEGFKFAKRNVAIVDLMGHELLPSPTHFHQKPLIYNGIGEDFILNQAYPPTTVKITIYSPANPLVIDDSGFKVGFDPMSGSSSIEILGASYTGSQTEPQVLTIPGALPGDYTVQLFGTATGTYTADLELLSTSGEIISSKTYKGSILPGQVQTASMSLSGTEMQSVAPIRMPPLIANDKLALAKYTKLELVWLKNTIAQMNIPQDVRDGLNDKLNSAIAKLDKIISELEAGNDSNAKQSIIPAKNIIQAFTNQVKAQQGKDISTEDANALRINGANILQDLEALKSLLV
ncbi:MAG: PKD domain-containing protein [Candidatus Methanoperedens sp.]|nr:PKD domain-containing protein [Candidatus Methanoperedens sp.]MCZ7370755.1 PKD domain-containing protein [Candidatus Methanoperedens sp.]